MKRFALLSAVAAALTLVAMGAANKFNAPHSIVHVVTILWKEDSTPEQQQASLEGVKKMAAEIPGIKNVWIKATRVQPREYNAAFALEFENKAAVDAYVDHPAHKAWQKIYEPIHKESRSQQITN